MDLNIDKRDVLELAADKIVAQFFDNVGSIENSLRRRIDERIDAILGKSAQSSITAIVDAVVKDGFDREFQPTTSWGEPRGEKTSIRKLLERQVKDYWSERVHATSGKPTDSQYNVVTRAEYVMTKVCAEDFSKGMKHAVVSTTGALKDGLRAELNAKVGELLDKAFRVQSPEDQGLSKKSKRLKESSDD